MTYNDDRAPGNSNLMYEGRRHTTQGIKVDSKKELEALKTQVNSLYRNYVETYSNMSSIMQCGDNGPLLHGAPEMEDNLGVTSLAQGLAIRGAKNNWPLLSKQAFADRMQELYSDKASK